MADTRDAATRRASRVTLVIGALAALMEGYDLQAAGVGGAKIAKEFALNSSQMGMVFTSNTTGLFLGAAVGGWLADRIGRKWVLALSLIVFGVFTVGSALANNYEMLVLMRFLTGLGLGGALPNLVSIVAESGPAEQRATRVTIITAFMPLGGVLSNLVVLASGSDLDWRVIFHFGGWPPILIGLAALALLPESATFLHHRREREQGVAAAGRRDTWSVLFREGRARSTLLLWITFFLTLLVLYMLLNWLPMLLSSKGFSRPETLIINMLFAAGGSLGSVVLAVAMTRLNRRYVLLGTYLAMGAALFALAAVGHEMVAASLVGIVVGFFVMGAQLVLYGLSATLYPGHVRGTGVGWGVAVGRLGSVAGPALAAAILAGGRSGSDVIMSILPAIAVATVTVMLLVWRAPPQGG